jgi:hypothetical protein
MPSPLHLTKPLAAAMALADRGLGQGLSSTLAVTNDPLRIDLPPVLRTSDISAETVRGLGSMYLQAELEQAGIAYAADLLAEQRLQLSIRSTPLAQLLEDYARRKREWLNRDERLRLFGRVFGIGTSTGPQAGAAVNNDFQRKFAVFASALLRTAEPWSGAMPPQTASPAELRQSGVDLLGNLAPLQYGNTLVAARQIQAQLRAAIAILSHEGMTTYLGVRTMWDVVRSIFGDQSPDLGRLVTRGQCGLRVFNWLADSIGWFLNPTPQPAPPLATAASLAAQWLEASGFQRRAA